MQNNKMQEAIAKRNSRMYQYYKSVFEDGFEGGYPVDWDEEIIRLAEESLVGKVKSKIQKTMDELPSDMSMMQSGAYVVLSTILDWEELSPKPKEEPQRE